MSRRPHLVAWAALAVLGVSGPGCGQREVAREPEHASVFFLSHLLFTDADVSMAVARTRAEQALDLLRKGTSFEELASTQSEDAASKLRGGFLGYIEFPAPQINAFHGAFQMLAEGQLADRPVLTELGWHVLKRHPYEEGRRLERRYWIPLRGMAIPWREEGRASGRDATLGKEEARALATQLAEQLRTGALTLAEARRQHTPKAAGRADGFLQNVPLRRESVEMFQTLERLREGEWMGPIEEAEGFAIVQRGRFLRSIVRHIAVQHLGMAERNPGVRRSPAEAQAVAEEALRAALAGTQPWPQLVRRYSDDVGTVDLAGSLGCVGNGELDPALEAAVLDTPPGALHPAVIPSPLGFHVLWRVD